MKHLNLKQVNLQQLQKIKPLKKLQLHKMRKTLQQVKKQNVKAQVLLKVQRAKTWSLM